MKFLNRARRGRSKSVDRNATARKNSRPREQPVYGRRTTLPELKEDASVGSDLPTLDQFEIAVPSKSFASFDQGSRKRNILPLSPEGREDDLDADNRSGISSITSVSYRAGYYYLRNLNKRNVSVEDKPKSGFCGTGSAPGCSCSWMTCCCCAEAKNELATQNTEMSAPLSKNSLLLDQSPAAPHSRAGINASRGRSQSPGRRAVKPGSSYRRYPSHSRGREGPPPRPNSARSRRRSSSRSRRMVAPPPVQNGGLESPMPPSIMGNHSLFDELSEDEEMYSKMNRRRQKRSPYHAIPNTKKSWLMRPQHNSNGQSSRSGPRGRGSRLQAYRWFNYMQSLLH